MKEVLFMLTDRYADWEAALVAAALNGDHDGPAKYCVKTVSADGKPVRSIGGFLTMPDYSLKSAPKEFVALLLIGGYSWKQSESDIITGLVKRAFDNGAIVGAICGATAFLGRHGFLNGVRHTSNSLDYLKEWAKDDYTGEVLYIAQQAVSDGGVITANGTAYAEFAREVLSALESHTPEEIDEWYDYVKLGQYEAEKKRGGLV